LEVAGSFGRQFPLSLLTFLATGKYVTMDLVRTKLKVLWTGLHSSCFTLTKYALVSCFYSRLASVWVKGSAE